MQEDDSPLLFAASYLMPFYTQTLYKLFPAIVTTIVTFALFEHAPDALIKV